MSPDTEHHPVDIIAAVENLVAEDYDRLRVRLWRQFGQQLHRIPDAPTPDDLLHEAIEDLLADRRHCPLARIDLTLCLVNIVRSKVSHLYAKWQQTGIGMVSDEVLEQRPIMASEDSALQETILALVSADSLLAKIVEYRLEHPDARAQEIADALELDMPTMYNANRRLKARLKGMVEK